MLCYGCLHMSGLKCQSHGTALKQRLHALSGVTAASDSSSDNDDDEEEAAAYDAEMQNGQPTPLLQSWGNKNFAKPLGKLTLLSMPVATPLLSAGSMPCDASAGIAARFQNSHKLGGQPQSYDSQDHLTEDSSLGSSPKMIIGSVEPVPMSC